MSDVILRKIMENARDLPDDLQQQVLEYVTSLSHPLQSGVRGQDLLRFAGTIPAADWQGFEVGNSRDFSVETRRTVRSKGLAKVMSERRAKDKTKPTGLAEVLKKRLGLK